MVHVDWGDDSEQMWVIRDGLANNQIIEFRQRRRRKGNSSFCQPVCYSGVERSGGIPEIVMKVMRPHS